MPTPRLPLLQLASLTLMALALARLASVALELELECDVAQPIPEAAPELTRLTLPEPRLSALFGLEPRPPAPAPLTPFQGVLLGTLVASRAGLSVATVELPGGKSVSVWEGESVLDARVRSIERGRITIERHGVEEIVSAKTLPSARGGAVTRLAPDTWAISRKAIFDRLANAEQLRHQIHVLPSFREGRLAGFSIVRLAPDSELAQLGVEAGDVIRSVDGQELSSPDHALKLYATLSTGSEVSLVLERRGQLISRRYRLD